MPPKHSQLKHTCKSESQRSCASHLEQAISTEFKGKYDRHQIRDRWHGQAEKQMFRHLGLWKDDEKERLNQVEVAF